METRPMSAHVTFRRWSLLRAFTPALVLGLIPLGTASAQSLIALRPTYGQPDGYLQVTRDKTEIECFGPTQDICMTAPKGTVLEILYTEGDRYDHRKSTWYWVLLPPDKFGNKLTGWVRGDEVVRIQPPQPTVAAKASASEAPSAVEAPLDEANTASVDATPAARSFISDVVVNFEFNKSALTEEARRTLEGAIVRPRPNAQMIAVALEGHTDWVGREAYNEQLGLDRAETVKRYLTEQLGIPAERISVVSYGENTPVAANTTREGRAQNRRVVIKAGGS